MRHAKICALALIMDNLEEHENNSWNIASAESTRVSLKNIIIYNLWSPPPYAITFRENCASSHKEYDENTQDEVLHTMATGIVKTINKFLPSLCAAYNNVSILNSQSNFASNSYYATRNASPCIFSSESSYSFW